MKQLDTAAVSTFVTQAPKLLHVLDKLPICVQSVHCIRVQPQQLNSPAIALLSCRRLPTQAQVNYARLLTENVG